MFRKQNGHLYTNRIPVADPAIRETNAKISITPDDGGGIRLSTLRTVRGLASMRWHWFYDTAIVTVSCKQTSADQLVKAINGALGARLERDKAGYFLNLDPKSLRQRATSMLEMPPKTQGSLAQLQGADRAYYRELLKVATDEQIRKAYSKYGQNVEFRIRKGSKLHELAVDRLYVASVAEGASPSIREMIDKVDIDGPILANLNSDGHIAAIYSGKAPNTQFVY